MHDQYKISQLTPLSLVDLATTNRGHWMKTIHPLCSRTSSTITVYSHIAKRSLHPHPLPLVVHTRSTTCLQAQQTISAWMPIMAALVHNKVRNIRQSMAMLTSMPLDHTQPEIVLSRALCSASQPPTRRKSLMSLISPRPRHHSGHFYSQDKTLSRT